MARYSNLLPLARLRDIFGSRGRSPEPLDVRALIVRVHSAETAPFGRVMSIPASCHDGVNSPAERERLRRRCWGLVNSADTTALQAVLE